MNTEPTTHVCPLGHLCAAFQGLLNRAGSMDQSPALPSAATTAQAANDDFATSPLMTIKESTTLLNRTEGALRHMIFQAEASAALGQRNGHDGFLACIVRPPDSRRVFIHRERAIALMESWLREKRPAALS